MRPLPTELPDLARRALQRLRSVLPRRKSSPLADAIGEADLARDAKNWRRAAQYYAKALEVKPDLSAIWVQYGNVLKEDGRLEESRQAYERALHLEPKDDDTHLQLGHLHKISGQESLAFAAYRRAAELNPQLGDAHRELRTLWDRFSDSAAYSLGYSSLADWLFAQRVRAENIGERLAKPRVEQVHIEPQFRSPEASSSDAINVFFEVTDLIEFVFESRRPTGIQRVQLEILGALLGAPPVGISIGCVSYPPRCLIRATPGAGRLSWAEIPRWLFRKLYDLTGSDGGNADWETALLALEDTFRAHVNVRFPPNSILINLGTSWWLGDYFARLRGEAERNGLKYFPFVHDLIPLRFPEFVASGQSRLFANWIYGALRHSTRILTNSEATATDINQFASKHGLRAAPAVPIKLDGEALSARSSRADDAEFLRELGLTPLSYVLFVGTIEPRKNHLTVLTVWKDLIEKHGADWVPTLVCVGKPGWKNEDVYARLAASGHVKARVQMLVDVSDAGLHVLYKHCLFSLLPSLYEGWGLPITESLAHRKVPIISRVGGQAEAGRDLAVYVEAESPESIAREVESLVLQPARREQLEARIGEHFQPRSWLEIGNEILSNAVSFQADRGNGSSEAITESDRFLLKPKTICKFGWLTEDEFAQGVVAGECFRRGEGWLPPEAWGCWMATKDTAIEFFPTCLAEGLVAYLVLRGLPSKTTTLELRTDGHLIDKAELASSEFRVLKLMLPPSSVGTPINLAISAHASQVIHRLDGALVIGVGAVFFAYCPVGDLQGQVDLLESITAQTLKLRTDGPSECFVA